MVMLQMLKRRIQALSDFDDIWLQSQEREIKLLRAELHELYRLLLLGGDTTIMGKPAQVVTTIAWPDGSPYGMTRQQIADCAP